MELGFKSIIKMIIIITFFVWFAALVFRSGVHIKRIAVESADAVPGYHEDVEICGDIPMEEEKMMYHRYINLGVECEN